MFFCGRGFGFGAFIDLCCLFKIACLGGHFPVLSEILIFIGGLALANIVSAKKRARQSIIRRDRNQQMKKAVRHLEKKVRLAISAKDKDGASSLLKEYTSAIGKAAQKGKFHSKTASRKISRLSLHLNKILGA